jgi:hypothetical protein
MLITDDTFASIDNSLVIDPCPVHDCTFNLLQHANILGVVLIDRPKFLDEATLIQHLPRLMTGNLRRPVVLPREIHPSQSSKAMHQHQDRRGRILLGLQLMPIPLLEQLQRRLNGRPNLLELLTGELDFRHLQVDLADLPAERLGF